MTDMKTTAIPEGWTAKGPAKLVRLGELPSGGVSRNHRDGTAEAGVSAYWAVLATDTADGETAWIVQSDGLDLASTMFIFAAKSFYGDTPIRCAVLVLTGEVVGAGSDGEPVVKVAKATREASHPVYFVGPTGWQKVTPRPRSAD